MAVKQNHLRQECGVHVSASIDLDSKGREVELSIPLFMVLVSLFFLDGPLEFMTSWCLVSCALIATVL